jgi:predicted nucleotidyltransferase
MATDEIIQQMVDRIASTFHPLRIILFGSYARGEAGEDSDVDLLVVFPAIEDKRQAAIAIRQVLADFPVPKDILVTTPEDISRRGKAVSSILRPALQEGKVLYEQAA